MGTKKIIYPIWFKKLVIEHHQEYKNIEDTIKIFKISRRSFFNWVKNKDNMDIDNNKKKIYKSKYSDALIKYILNYVRRNKCFCYKKLIGLVKKNYDINISKTCIYDILKKNNITYKKINTKISYSNKQKHKEDLKKLKDEIKKINKNDIISIDETSIDTHISSLKGWSKKGTKIIHKKNIKRKRSTVISAVSNKEIIHYITIDGSANKNTFMDFINEVIKKTKNKPILMDNARIHHTLVFKKLIKEKKLNILYNVPYCPEYNPIERVFSKLKHILRTKKNDTKESLLKNLNYAMNRITNNDLQNFYEKSFYLLEKS